MRHLILCSVMWLCGLMMAVGQNVPQVIPALQQWKSAKGKLVLPETGKVIVSSDEENELKGEAEILVQDLKEMFGWEYSVVVGKKEKGAVYLTLGKPDKTLGEEGYRMNIQGEVTIEAPTSKGVFWGTRTLLQMIHNQPEGLMKGRATDFPLYPNRGFMIDVGRKFFTMDYLRDYVKILSFYKMNELQVHLNDNGFVEFFDNDWNKTYAAFRLESERFPGLTAKDGSYTKEEFRDFQIMAARYGVNVIPEIDVPAHSLAFTHYNPRLAADKKEYGMDHLDLYKPEVYEFVDALFDEYLSGENPVFVGPEVHIGTDEYNQKEAEQFRHFTNHYLDFVSKYGKTPRLWGSLSMMKGNTPVDLKGKVVSAWNHGWMDVQTCLDAGAKVVNLCDGLLYIVPAVNYYHDFLDYQWLYESWMPEMMRKDDPKMTVRHPNFLGAMLAVWNDRVGNGISEQDVHLRTFPGLQVACEKMWKGENADKVPFEQFMALCAVTPEAPGVNLLAKVDKQTTLTEIGKEVTEFSDGAFYKDNATGILFFGGVNGFVTVKPDSYITTDYMPEISLKGLSIFGKEYNLHDFLHYKDGKPVLQLDYKHNFFQLNFRITDYINGNDYFYSYKLKEASDQWIENGVSPNAIFSNLSPGEYTLFVKYRNNINGKESHPQAFTIYIAPPWPVAAIMALPLPVLMRIPYF